MNSLPKINKKKISAKSKLFCIEEIDLTFSNGCSRKYERITPHSDDEHKSVLIVPMIDESNILLVREYSVGIENYTLSFPKGGLLPGEKIFDAADRELVEEVSLTANKYTFLKNVRISPNYMKNNTFLVKAENLTSKFSKGDEPEKLTVVKWSLSNVDSLINHSDFIECKSLTALLLIWKSWLKK